MLVVDDDQAVRDGVRHLLETRGLTVITARGGFEALRELEVGAPPDLILTDLDMPDGSGQALVGTLRRCPTCRDVPVVIMTGERVERALASPGCTWMAKPLDVEGLLEAVARLGVTIRPRRDA